MPVFRCVLNSKAHEKRASRWEGSAASNEVTAARKNVSGRRRETSSEEQKLLPNALCARAAAARFLVFRSQQANLIVDGLGYGYNEGDSRAREICDSPHRFRDK